MKADLAKVQAEARAFGTTVWFFVREGQALPMSGWRGGQSGGMVALALHLLLAMIANVF